MNRLIIGFFLVLCTYLLIAQDQSTNVVGARFESFPLEEMDKQSAFVEANQQLILGNTDKAIELLDKFLYENDKEGAAWYTLARAQLVKKDFTKSLEAIKKASALEPDNQWFVIMQANLLEETGRSIDAAVLYEKLVSQHPSVEEYYHTLGYYYVLAGEPDKGLATYDMAEKRFGVSPETVDKKYLIFLASNDMKNARQELEKLVQTYPSDIQFQKRLAQFYAKNGNKNEAKAAFEQILVMDETDAEARLYLATNAGSNPNASSDLSQIIADPKADIDAKIKKLLPLVAKLQESPTPQLSEKLIGLAVLLEQAHPKEAKAWSFSGDVHYLSEKDDLALEKYQKCIDLFPTVYSVWENTMQILFEKGAYTKLVKTSEDAVDAFPNQALSYYYYGFAQNKLEKADDALPMLMQSKLMVAGNPQLALDILDQIGLSQLILGNTEQAEKTLTEVLEKSKNQHPGALEHWGDLLEKKGKSSEAMKFWQKAYDLNPNQDLAEKVKAR